MNLADFVKTTIEDIENGLEDNHRIDSTIDFELAVIHSKGVNGGFNILVVDGKGKYQKESISRVKFSARRKTGGHAGGPLGKRQNNQFP